MNNTPQLNMFSFAKHIIETAHENSLNITNLQLQKVMYFTLQYALRYHLLDDDFVRNMYDEKFLVWRYGPVEKSIYEEYKIYGSDPITDEYETLEPLNKLNSKIIELIKDNPFKLVRESHSEPFWQKNEQYIDGWRSTKAYNLENVASGE
ncbi:Panacea domain-containing protein [Apilactobacillus micheneri]|nr:type II toxin-antitoxin system antitoxin SocA domain-containing protein [Apilactobacillus micheneri]